MEQRGCGRTIALLATPFNHGTRDAYGLLPGHYALLASGQMVSAAHSVIKALAKLEDGNGEAEDGDAPSTALHAALSQLKQRAKQHKEDQAGQMGGNTRRIPPLSQLQIAALRAVGAYCRGYIDRHATMPPGPATDFVANILSAGPATTEAQRTLRQTRFGFDIPPSLAQQGGAVLKLLASAGARKAGTPGALAHAAGTAAMRHVLRTLPGTSEAPHAGLALIAPSLANIRGLDYCSTGPHTSRAHILAHIANPVFYLQT